MTSHARAFTLEIDKLLLDQVEARASVTGRTLSREISYLCAMALRELHSGRPEQTGAIGEVERKCVSFSNDTFDGVIRYAAETQRPIGRTINMLLRTALDHSAAVNIIRGVAPMGQSAPGM